jgi:hypothetical protein
MHLVSLVTKMGIGLTLWTAAAVAASAQQELSQDQLFDQYQAMVIVEEANQHCPILSRLEAEVLRGQIVFANDSFAGKLDMVEKFKKEARIYARRSPCNSPQIMGLVGLARQAAYDYMINHLLLARKINQLDENDREAGIITKGLLLDFLSEQEWAMIDGLREEVKANYLEQANQEAWDKYTGSIENVANDRTAKVYLENDGILKAGATENFQNAQAMARNKEITTYYFHLDRVVRSFIDGATAEIRNYPFSRPANDFTDWLSFRPRDGNANWVVSYPGCGGFSLSSDCTLFTTAAGEIGVVVNADTHKITAEFRNPENSDAALSNKTVEGPIGSNELNKNNMDANLEVMLASSDKMEVEAELLTQNTGLYAAQTGGNVIDDTKVFLFPQGTLSLIEKLDKNDVIYLTVDTDKEEGNNRKTVMPVHNYHRARNWAYSIQ